MGDPQCRLITLVGPGGIGKTRLAIEASCDQHGEYKDGAGFVSMAGVNSPALIVPAIANGLGLALKGATDPKKQLMNHLRDRQILLVLDNAEHLLGDITIFAEIIQSAPRVKMLCTSREPLNLRGEWLFEVKGLPFPRSIEGAEFDNHSAVTLFLQRANQVKMMSSLNHEDRTAIAYTCKMVQGMTKSLRRQDVSGEVLS